MKKDQQDWSFFLLYNYVVSFKEGRKMSKKMHSRVKSKANLKILKKKIEQKEKNKTSKQQKQLDDGIPYISCSLVFISVLCMIYKLFSSTN
tara:strand:+ start:601 stop:873 length:273 start_codon:yes stop_codon:yes gene_type:complete